MTIQIKPIGQYFLMASFVFQYLQNEIWYFLFLFLIFGLRGSQRVKVAIQVDICRWSYRFSSFLSADPVLFRSQF